MKNINTLVISSLLLAIGCGNVNQKKPEVKEPTKEQQISDSLQLLQKVQQERAKAIKDSITLIEQEIAIGNISFNISEKEFEKQKALFLKKCRLPEYEFYKHLTIFTYKIGEYGFSDLYGWLHNDSLYKIRLRGPIVDYDEYDRVMPDQYKALSDLLKEKYGAPTTNYGLPQWTDLEKGYYQRCDIWDIGNKRIEIQVSCEGVEYYLNVEVHKPEVERRIQLEKELKEKESIKKAVEIL